MTVSYDDIIEILEADKVIKSSNKLVALLGDHYKPVVKVGHTSGDGKVHAILGASSADRWFKCPGSIRMSKGMPNRSSRYAQEGTVAHHLCELSLDSDVAPHWFIGQWLDSKGNLTDDAPEETEDENLAFEIDEDMADAVSMYTNYICEEIEKVGKEYPSGKLHTFLEKGFDLSRLYPGMFGTNDYSIFVEGEILIVIDYKHGRGKVVEAKNNPQLLYYALGAILEICKDRGTLPKIIRTVIVQPRAAHRDGPIREWDYTLDEVIAFSEELVAAAIRTEDPNAPLVPGESQCFFCNGKARPCPAVFERAQELALQDFTDVGDEELVMVVGAKTELTASGIELSKAMVEKTLSRHDMMLAVLKMAPVIDSWIRDIEAYAQHEHENGRPIMDENGNSPYKLVRKRSNRKHKNEEATIKDLKAKGFKDKDIYKEPKVKTPAQLEKVKGITKDVLADLIFHPLGTLTLVTQEDARPAIEVNPFGDVTDAEMAMSGHGVIEGTFKVIEGEPDFDLVDDSEWDIL